MKNLMAMAAWLLLAGWLGGQERLDQDKAQRIGKILAEHAAKLKQVPLLTEVDSEQPCGLRAGEHGVLVLPSKNLSADTIARAGKEAAPLGQLWCRQVTLHLNGKAVANDRLRLVTVTYENQDHQLPLFLLGVQKAAAGGVEMVLFGKDNQPLLKVPLQKTQVSQKLPIELEAKLSDDSAELTFNLLGKYVGRLTVTRQVE